jgi:hypothetical protein
VIQVSASCNFACHNFVVNGRFWSGPFLSSLASAQE